MRRLFLLILVLGSAVQGVRSSSGIDEIRQPKQLKWPVRTIRVFVSSSMFGSLQPIKPESDVNGAILNALGHWEEAAGVEFKVAISDMTSISPPGFAGDGISLITIAPEPENMLAFSNKKQNASGLTRVFYDSRGAITEADIVLNPAEFFTTDSTPATFDLETVLTHEIGHFLGLSHSVDASSVMFDGVPRNGGVEVEKRSHSLSSDDRTKIQRLYRSGRIADNCCVNFKGRLEAAEVASGTNRVWVQDARSGALMEVTDTRDKRFKFGPFAPGSYEMFVQSSGSAKSVSGAGHFRVNETQSPLNIVFPTRSKPVAFDLQLVGLNGDLSKRAVKVKAGNSYRLLLAGKALGLPDLRFGTTSEEIVIESLSSESWSGGNVLEYRAFQLNISRFVRPGQYSIFAEDGSGFRRYIVGGISVN